MDDRLNFKISSALKNLIGKELITDELVAVFELVKNSFDANAQHVKIIFENTGNTKLARIIIVDDGKGMDENDLKNKWLFVGYSAKNDGTENEDYRSKIASKRIFAGAKGIGRFSCDKLGTSLNLRTKKDSDNSNVENLIVNWENFEQDAKKEFINIPVEHKILDKIGYSLESGTVLEISNLRDIWNRQRKLKLKHSLEKLINPIQENDVQNFSIEIVSLDENIIDNDETDARKKVNGKVTNFVFELLNLKTTQVVTEISADGEKIKTTLKDRGRDIYTLTEKNMFSISNVRINLFQLNRSAKSSFTSLMGVHSVEYGSVFMYKNGFRIYPFGEEGEDLLGIDRRKQQGYNRFLGTRDLIGRIEINGENSDFRETTSRDGGLEKNKSFYELVEFFKEKALKRLESYVVDVIKWGDPEMDKERITAPALQPEDVREEIIRIISNLTKAKDIIDIQYDENFLQIIDSRQEKSLSQIAKNFSRIADETNNPHLIQQARLAEHQIKQLAAAKREVEQELDYTKETKDKVEKQLDQKIKQNLFLQSIQTLDTDKIINYHHDIGVQSQIIQNCLNTVAKLLFKPDIDVAATKKYFEMISKANNKILSISRFATKANFNSSGEKINADVVLFIEQYTETVKEFFSELQIDFTNKQKIQYFITFKPIEISVLIDNLISNAMKPNAKAKNFCISVTATSANEIVLSFANDGAPLANTVENPKDIFAKGFSTTNGSGLGLYHSAIIVETELHGNIEVNADYPNGFELKVVLHK